MSNILSKSPYIVEVSATGLTGGKVEIFLWKEGSTISALPQYTLSKLSPASNVTKVYFDVAPYVNEYISTKFYNPNSEASYMALPIENYCNVTIKEYKIVGGVTTYLSSETKYGFKGFLFQKDSINGSYLNALLDQKTYYYHYDSSKTYSNYPAGDITYLSRYYPLFPQFVTLTYTNLVTNVQVIKTEAVNGWVKMPRVLPANWAVGNKLEISYTNDPNPEIEPQVYYFKPMEECKYSPIILDFVNKYGAWQREFLFKNSTESISMENQTYKNYRTNPIAFNSQESLSTTFNTNATESIKTNTGWVDESYKDTITQLLLSDNILLNNRPATITTKQIDLQKNINNKLINYSLDFQFSNSVI